MSLLFLKKIPRVSFKSDELSIKPDCEGWKFEFHLKNSIYNTCFSRNDEKYYFNVSIRGDIKVFYCGNNRFLIRQNYEFPKVFNYFIFINNGQIYSYNISHGNIHVSDQYFISLKIHPFTIDMESGERKNIEFYEDLVTLKKFYFPYRISEVCKKYILYHKNDITYVFIWTDFPPEHVDMSYFLIESKYSKLENKSFKVHFNDQIKIMTSQELDPYESYLILQQSQNSDEIYLDINFKNFDISNFETMKYLMSDKVKDMYKEKLIKELINDS